MATLFTRSEPILKSWGMLKDKEYSINPYTKDDLKENIQNVGSPISPAEL
jgi:hypothetical protein